MKIFLLIRKIFSYLIIIVAFYFIFQNIFVSWGEIRSTFWQLNIYLIILSYLLLFPSLFLYVYAWQLIIKEIEQEKKIGFFSACGIITVSNLGKYVPGKIWFALSRLDLAKRFGFEEKKVFLSILLESFYLLLGALFYFIFFLKKYYFFLILFLFVFIAPKIFKGFFNLVLKMLKKEKIDFSFSLKKSFLIFLLDILVWFFQGSAFSLLVKAIYFKINFAHFLSLIGIYSLSWMLGFLVLIAPGGLGVREGSMMIFLKNILPVGLASLLAIISRIWLIIHELLNFLIFGLFFLTKMRKKDIIDYEKN